MSTTLNLTSRVYSIHTLTPLHVGSGEGAGGIDLPIIREKVTEWPFVPGSTIKGVKRSYYELQSHHQVEDWFGHHMQQEADASAGALVFSDARLLAFPVASRFGTFAYVTCPLAIERFHRDLAAAGQHVPIQSTWLQHQQQLNDPDEAKVIVCEKSQVCEKQSRSESNQRSTYAKSVSTDKVFLDELEADSMVDASFTQWAEWSGSFLFGVEDSFFNKQWWREHLVMVSDELFQHIVNLSCEVISRIRMDEQTGTVKRGALWNEEYIPTEAILYGLIWCDRVKGSSNLQLREDMLNQLHTSTVLQIGGNASVGKGRVQFRVHTLNDITVPLTGRGDA
ncbi:type III-B CRISPR module RAMP protein Cmr4 [Paenibacillus sp. WLX1005]|uniref:type III-B CRISPR module RAMP protein Cmr4 n=1 Tax=Paenibacillus sp. WLX1005 TaxID=3243766 RepID=UPI0039845169